MSNPTRTEDLLCWIANGLYWTAARFSDAGRLLESWVWRRMKRRRSGG